MGKELAIIEDLELLDGSKATIDIFTSREKADEFLKSTKDFVLSIDTDVSTPKGQSNITSIAYKVSQMKSPIERAGKALVQKQKDAVKLIDQERIRLVKEIDLLKVEVKKPLTELKEKEDARKLKHENELLNIGHIIDSVFQLNQGDIEEAKKSIEKYSNMDFQEFRKRADESIALFEKSISDRIEDLNKEAELARLKKEEEIRLKKEREEQIAREAKEKAEQEAAEKARLEAERVEREKKEAEEKAERDRQAAQKVIDDAEAARVKAIEDAAQEKIRVEVAAKKAAEEAESAKQKAIEEEREKVEALKVAEEMATAKREADKKHRSKINNEAMETLINELAIQPPRAKEIITFIAQGKIPNVSIKY